MEHPESIAGAVEFVAGVAGEVEAEILVMVKHGRVDGAIEEGKDGVLRRRYYDGLNIRQNKVVVGLQNGASRHCWVVDHHCLLVVVNGLDFVDAGRCGEEQVVGAVEHVPELRSAAPIVEAEGIFYWDVTAGGAAERETGESRKGLQ